ncbi:aminopeptidase A-like [Lycorma delicatula]|uniref:aminopeptidase A-like n=1 Tax=Lycorma delicatula TaxID=130591 RepID=UPI003F517BC0
MSSPVTRCAVISCFIAIVLVAVFFGFRYLQKSSDSNREWEKSHRLPESVIPSTYSILLNPDLHAKIFYGQNNITFNLTENRNNIIIHSKGLNISKTELFDSSGDLVPLEQTFEYPDNEFWVVITQNQLIVGKYFLYLDFRGNLTGKIVGLYRSKYVAPDGTKRKKMDQRNTE